MCELPCARFPEEAGVSLKGIENFVNHAFEQGVGFHSVVAVRHGKVAAKINFAPYDDQTPSVLFSLSKTFCSCAAGFAVQEGLLSWDSKVSEVLKEDLPENPGKGIEKIELKHLLCMGSGLDPRSDQMAVHQENWVRDILSFDVVKEPGTFFNYNSHGTYLVSRMVQKKAGMNIRDYLMPRLFEPLGIEKPDWDTCPMGVCLGGWGLRLSASSIAKFGQLLLQKGVWQGKQLLPQGWVELASTSHIDNSNGVPQPESDWAQGYGYQIWRCRFDRFRGDGMYGQLCVVDPKLDMVVSCVAGVNDIQKEMNLIHELFEAGRMWDEEKTKEAKALAPVSYPVPEKTDEEVPLGTYRYQDMEKKERSFKLCMKNDKLAVDWDLYQLFYAPESLEIEMGNGDLYRNQPVHAIKGEKAVNFVGAYGKEGKNLKLVCRTLDAPFCLDLTIHFPDDEDKELYCISHSIGFPIADGKTLLKKN